MVARIDRDGNIIRDLETGPLIGSIPEVSSPSLISFLPDSLKSAGVTRRVLALQWILYVISCFVPPVGFVEPSSLALLRIGSDSRSFLQCAACGYVLEIRRLLFPIFMHSGVAHILMNTLFQIYTCAEFETLLGSKSFIVQYVGAGIFGNLCYAMYGESGVGASGACYGLLGAGAMRLYISWPSMEPVSRENAKSAMLRQAAILVFLELVAWNSVAHGAHIGGLISGACIYAVLTGSSTSPREMSLVWYCKAGLSAITFVALLFIIYPVTMNFRTICVECESLMSIYRMFFIHRVLNVVTMMYNEADELTACHFIRPSTYYKHSPQPSHQEDAGASESKQQQDTAPIVDSSDEEEKLNQS